MLTILATYLSFKGDSVRQSLDVNRNTPWSIFTLRRHHRHVRDAECDVMLLEKMASWMGFRGRLWNAGFENIQVTMRN